MKEIYIKKLLLFCCFLFAFIGVTIAQQHTLTISSTQDTLTSSYALSISQVGEMEYAPPLTKALYTQSTLACDTLVSPDAAGKIVLIDRGTCAFLIKYEAAVKAGAAGVIICNNDTVNANTGIVITGLALTTNPIPLFATSYNACKSIKASLSSSDSLEVSISPSGCPTPREYDPSVFWGHLPGQGDFSNGKGDWVVNKTGADNESFAFYSNNRPMTGAFNGGTAIFTSPTVCNGVAAFSFVKYNLLNNPTLAGPPYYFSSAELISPTIDCSGKEFVAMEFYMINHRLNGDVSYAFSTDDGETWSEPVELERTTIVTSGVADKVLISLLDFANQPKCKVKFIADGDFYFFMLDDVTFIDKKVFDMTISKDYYGSARNYATPFNQVEETYFTLDIENTGNVPTENVAVALDIFDYTTDEPILVYTDTINYGSVEPGVRDADRIFATTFTPEEKEAYYVAAYTLLADSVELDGDTEAFVDFETTKNVFSKMPVDPELINGWKLGSDNFISGASFYKIKKGTWPDGQPITLDKGLASAAVNISSEGANTTAILSFDVYKWVDTNQDTFVIQGEERTLLASGSIIIEDGVDTVSIELFDPLDPSKKVVLPNEEMNLIAVVSISPIDETGTNWFIGSNNPFQGDNLGRYHSYTAALADINSGGAVWSGSFYGVGTADDIATRDLEQTTLTIFSPLYFSDVEIVSNKELNTSLKINAYPIPAVTNINVDLSFEKTQDYANIIITDMTGKLVHVEKYVNIQARNLNVDVSRFAAGVYNLRVVTENGFNTQNFSVVK